MPNQTKIEVMFREGIFYDFLNTLISLLTWRKYSHVEIYVKGYSYSATIKDGVRAVRGRRTKGEWRTIELAANEYQISRLRKKYKELKKKKYDFLGMIYDAWLGRSDRQDPNKFYCSEVCMELLNHAYIKNYDTGINPGLMFNQIQIWFRSELIKIK